MSDNQKEAILDLRFIVEVWNENYRKITLTSLFISFSVYFATLLISDLYEAEVKLSKTSTIDYFKLDENSSSRSSYGGVSDFLSGEKDKTLSMDEIAIEFIESKSYIVDFLKTNNFEADLLAITDIDTISGELTYDLDIFDPVSNKIRKDYFVNQAVFDQALYEAFENRFRRVQAFKPIYKFKFRHVSPQFTEEILNALIIDINNFLKSRELGKSKKRSLFLEERLAGNNIPEIDKTLTALLLNELQRQLFMETTENFVFEIIDPPTVSIGPIYPVRIIIFMFSLFSSFLFLFIFKIFRT